MAEEFQRRDLRLLVTILAAIILVACAITLVFNVLTSEASLRSAIQGLLDAVLITLLVGGYLMFVRDGRARVWFQRLGFWADLTLSSAIVLAVTIQFILQMNRMIGANVLGYFVAGVYHRPKAEERIFLFLDLEGSTQLAERLGSARYFGLLRRFVKDLTEPVLGSSRSLSFSGDRLETGTP